MVVYLAKTFDVVSASSIEKQIFEMCSQCETLTFQVDDSRKRYIIDSVAQLFDLMAQEGLFEVHEEVLIESTNSVEENFRDH